MIQWGKRTPEVSSLLNPPFCAVILYAVIAEYQKRAQAGMAFPLLYLILPIILHKDTRSRVSSRTNMIVWLQRNPDALIGFPERARSLVPFTNEAIEFMLHQHTVSIVGNGIIIKKPISKAGIDKYLSTDYEIADCIQKTAHLGRWFLNMRSDESVYAAWGVRP